MKAVSDRLVTALLWVASLVLPSSGRARWREEALAVLLAVHGRRRWWYTADTVGKVPILAWQQYAAIPPRWAAQAGPAFAGSFMLVSMVLLVGGFLGSSAIGEDAAEFFVAISFCGMAPMVALWMWRHRQQQGWVPLVGAAGVALLAGTGPIAAAVLANAVDVVASPAVVVPIAAAAGAAPGLWFVWSGVLALRRREGPAGLATLGVVVGCAMGSVLVNLQLISRLDSPLPPLFNGLALLGLLTTVPTYVVWTVWAAIRMVTGRSGPLPAALAKPDVAAD